MSSVIARSPGNRDISNRRRRLVEVAISFVPVFINWRVIAYARIGDTREYTEDVVTQKNRNIIVVADAGAADSSGNLSSIVIAYCHQFKRGRSAELPHAINAAIKPAGRRSDVNRHIWDNACPARRVVNRQR